MAAPRARIVVQINAFSPYRLWSLSESVRDRIARAFPTVRVVQSRDGEAFVKLVGGEWESDPVPLAPRPRPQGHLSVVRDDRAHGTLYCIDARRNAPGAVKARLRTMVPNDKSPRVLGDVPLMADGSFHVRVPHDTPISFEMLDAAGSVVAAERGPIWVRPNEVRGCVGCHDDVGDRPAQRPSRGSARRARGPVGRRGVSPMKAPRLRSAFIAAAVLAALGGLAVAARSWSVKHVRSGWDRRNRSDE